jgi:hypothetical protein
MITGSMVTVDGGAALSQARPADDNVESAQQRLAWD